MSLCLSFSHALTILTIPSHTLHTLHTLQTPKSASAVFNNFAEKLYGPPNAADLPLPRPVIGIDGNTRDRYVCVCPLFLSPSLSHTLTPTTSTATIYI